MNGEEIVEQGIVISSENGSAVISLSGQDKCEACSAKIICKPSDGEKRTVRAFDPFNTIPGDFVRISIKGSILLKLSILLYGLPLIIFLVGIMLFVILFNESSSKELLSFLTGILLLFFYYLILYFYKKKFKSSSQPKIISVNRKNI